LYALQLLLLAVVVSTGCDSKPGAAPATGPVGSFKTIVAGEPQIYHFRPPDRFEIEFRRWSFKGRAEGTYRYSSGTLFLRTLRVVSRPPAPMRGKLGVERSMSATYRNDGSWVLSDSGGGTEILRPLSSAP